MHAAAISEQAGRSRTALLDDGLGTANFPQVLKDMLSDIGCAAEGPPDRRDRDVAAALAPYLGASGLLDHIACPGEPDKYARYLLHAGAGYTVLALVWRPRQMSPVHAHRTWCTFGVHQGWMTETLFTAGSPEPRPLACVPRKPGDVVHAPADPDKIHRLANLGINDALSIHIYGAPYDRLGHDVNEIWAS